MRYGAEMRKIVGNAGGRFLFAGLRFAQSRRVPNANSEDCHHSDGAIAGHRMGYGNDPGDE